MNSSPDLSREAHRMERKTSDFYAQLDQQQYQLNAPTKDEIYSDTLFRRESRGSFTDDYEETSYLSEISNESAFFGQKLSFQKRALIRKNIALQMR